MHASNEASGGEPIAEVLQASGCSIFIAVQQEDDFIHPILASDRDEVGAEVSFVGRVRATEKSQDDAKRLVALDIEHYASMTRAELVDLCREAASRWELHSIAVFHRFGRLPVGERIVQVDVTSGHREAAFMASRFVMDFLKISAPFWKKAIFEDGDEQWIEQKQSDRAASAAWDKK